MRLSFISLVPFLLFSLGAEAQSSFLPKNLGPSVNSSYDDINPVISPDEKTLFFVRANHPENTFGPRDSEDIWYCEQINNAWTAASRVPNLNIGRYNAVLSVSADGRSILLNGVYNKKGNIWKKRGLSVSGKIGDGWATPQRLKVKKLSKKNRGMRSSGFMSSDGKAIVLSFSKIFNGERNDLYVCEKKENGKWGKPVKAKGLNTRANEETPFLSVDGKTVFFSSDRDTKGQFNIYKSGRSEADWKNWSAPLILSDTINSSGWESYFKTTAKGSWAYFSSTNKSIGKADIYRIKLFEENPFVIVSGKVFNSKNKKPLIGKSYSILSDGRSIDSLKVNFDSATYRAKLPLNKVHILTAHITNFISQPQSVDVKGVREFTRMKVDLYLSPLPYVIVRGKLLIQNTGLPVPVSANAKILINNLPGDSVQVDTQAATYEMKINHGVAYELKLVADRLEAIPKSLDLTSVDEYQEMIVDLFVAEEKMAVVTGKILDKKTNKPLTKLSSAKVNVEGMSSVLAKIDTVTGDYELKLPLGSAYTISAGAPNYYPVYESVNLSAEKTNVKIYKDLVIVPIEVGQSIRLNNIFFDPSKAILKAESFAELDRVADFLAKNTDIKVEIAGHTDNVGKAASNLKLSKNRAQSVADYIIKKGISKEKIVAKGYGFTKPVATNATKAGKAQNRRVEFTILDK